MSPSSHDEQVKMAIVSALDLLSPERRARLLQETRAMIQAQRREHDKIPQISESEAISTCAIEDEALEAQEKVLEEIINAFEIDKLRHKNPTARSR